MTAPQLVHGPQPSSATRRWEARLHLYRAIRAGMKAIDLSDVLTVLALVFVFVGLAMPSWAFGVVGALLLPLTPIWASIRATIRGR